MAEVFDYTKGKKITIENVIKAENYIALDAGTPVKKVDRLFSDVKDKPCVKWEYAFYDDGTFVTGTKNSGTGVVTRDASTTITGGHDYVVIAHEKFKSMDRLVPAYRTFNAKLLKPGEKVVFNTTNKDEIVFFEKLQAAFEGELKVTFEDLSA